MAASLARAGGRGLVRATALAAPRVAEPASATNLLMRPSPAAATAAVDRLWASAPTTPARFFSAEPAEAAADDEPASGPPEDVPPKIEELCESLCQLNVVEMNQLVKAFKAKVGITGDVMPMMGGGMPMMAPMAAPAAAPAGGDGAAAAEEEAPAKEKDAFELKLTGFDDKGKIKVIKEVRAITGLGLKEAKELVEGAPKTIKKDLPKAEAEELMAKLKEVGAEVEML